MKQHQNPIESVTKVIQLVKKREIAADLAHQLRQLLPSNLRQDSPMIATYAEVGLMPETAEHNKDYVQFKVIDKAIEELFNQQDHLLVLELLDILGFHKEPPILDQSVISSK